MTRKAAAAFLAAGVLGAALCGCAGYRLGTTLPPDIRTIYVPTFVNDSGEPQVEIDATRAAIDELQRDGTLKVRGETSADVKLVVRLTNFRLEPLRYDTNQAKTANEYRLRLTGHLVLTRRANGEKVVDRWVSGETTFEPGGDLAGAKVAAIPAAAEDLAHDIVESVVEYW